VAGFAGAKIHFFLIPASLKNFFYQNDIFHSYSDILYFRSFFFQSKMGKNLYIIGGCNGAGKTTASYTILPEILDCREFVNADEIAYGLSPFNPEGVAVEAGRLALMRVAELLERDETFSIETTLAARTLVKLVRRAQNQGYNVSLLFFWLNSMDLAIQRVAERVRNGGHNVPEKVIRSRYVSGIHNLFNLYANAVDYWTIFDNSESPRRLIATGGRSRKTKVIETELFNQIKKYVQQGN
jgi:predicted ABC-type ATPase